MSAPKVGDMVAVYGRVLAVAEDRDEVKVELFSKTDQYAAWVRFDLLDEKREIAACSVDLDQWRAFDTDGVEFTEAWFSGGADRVRFERGDGGYAIYPGNVKVKCVRRVEAEQ